MTVNFPTPPSSVDSKVRVALAKLKQAVNSQSSTNTSLTSQISALNTQVNGVAVYQTPDAPTGFNATGAFAMILLSWSAPTYTGHAYTEVWRNDVDNLATAVNIADTQAALYADTPPTQSLEKDYYYFCRHVNLDGLAGPFNSASGTLAHTADDPEYLLQLINNSKWIASTAFSVGDRIYAQNGAFIVTVAGTTGTTEPTWDSTVGNDTVDNTVTWQREKDFTLEPPYEVGVVGGIVAMVIRAAFIGDLTVTNAMIKELAADKILAGTITAYLKIIAPLIQNAETNPTAILDLNASAPYIKLIDALGKYTQINPGTFKCNDGTTNILEFNGTSFTLRDSSGNIVLTSGGAIWDYVTGVTKPADNADVTNYDDYRVTNRQLENNVTTIANPQGGSYSNNTNVTGAIKVTLPQSWTGTMLKFEVDVYLYDLQSSFKLLVGGYNYDLTPEWLNEFAQIIGNTVSNNRVRFGHDGTNCCIIIGETTTVWAYPQIAVKNFQAGFANYEISKWETGWNVGIVTDLTGVTFTGDFSDALLDAKSILGQGALATVSSADWATQVAGTGKPADSADVTSANPQAPSWLTDPVVWSGNQITSTNIATYIANLAVGSAQIANLAVGSLSIAGDAVTVPYAISSVTSANTNAATWLDVLTLTVIVPTAASIGGTVDPPVVVSGFINFYNTFADNSTFVRIVRDTTQLGEIVNDLGLNDAQNNYGFTFLDSPVNGTHTYKLQIQSSSTLSTIFTTSRGLYCGVVKK